MLRIFYLVRVFFNTFLKFERAAKMKLATNICAKLVLKKLTPNEKLVRHQIYSVLERLEEEPEKCMTCNETGIFQYNVKTIHARKTFTSPKMNKQGCQI